MALYQAKAEKRGGYQFFKPEMDEGLRRRVELEHEIGSAIDAGHIIPYYQPVIDLRSGDVVALEVLARWEHPTHGLLPPQVLIPVADSTGTISQITYSLLRQAITDAAIWPKDLSLSLNISPRQFVDRWLPEEVLRILAEQSFPARRLELEITETALFDKMDEGDAGFVAESRRQNRAGRLWCGICRLALLARVQVR